MEEFFTEEVYKFVFDLSKLCSGYIAEVWGKFDQYNYDEQVAFGDIVNDLENIILDCNKYFYAYDKFFRNATKQQSYRVRDIIEK